MKPKNNQMTVFDWMLLIVVAAFASKAAKTLWIVWQNWPIFVSSDSISYEWQDRIFIECMSWATAAVVAALIIFFRNRWHQRKEGR